MDHELLIALIIVILGAIYLLFHLNQHKNSISKPKGRKRSRRLRCKSNSCHKQILVIPIDKTSSAKSINEKTEKTESICSLKTVRITSDSNINSQTPSISAPPAVSESQNEPKSSESAKSSQSNAQNQMSTIPASASVSASQPSDSSNSKIPDGQVVVEAGSQDKTSQKFPVPAPIFTKVNGPQLEAPKSNRQSFSSSMWPGARQPPPNISPNSL